MAGEKPEQKEHWNDWIAKKTGKSESLASRREQKNRNDRSDSCANILAQQPMPIGDADRITYLLFMFR